MKYINNYGRVRTSARALLWLIFASSASGLLAAAFQCPLPHPWKAKSPQECQGARPIALYNGVSSIVTDLMLCCLAVAMIWDLKIDRKKKAIVVTLFFTRIL